VPHFFVPPGNKSGLFFSFDPSESRHLSKVLRKKAGDLVVIFDGQGGVQKARILNVSNPLKVTGEILDSPGSPESAPRPCQTLEIFPALIKGPRFEWLIEKLTELGVASIHPVLTERTLVRLQPDQAEKKLNRWKKIALAASKQSGRSDVPTFLPPVPLEEALTAQKGDALDLMLWEGEEITTLSQTLLKFRETRRSRGNFSVRLFVGPEGGLTIQEVEKAKKNGVRTVNIGPNILRAETAALASAAVVMLLHG